MRNAIVQDKQLDNTEYLKFRNFLEQQCGIVLGDNKLYLVKSRLAPLMNQFNVNSLTDLVNRTLNPMERQLRAAVIDAMTTNETLWFRDIYPFELLKKLIIENFAGFSRPIKIWSAACSSGQEPYSIAMTIAELQQTKPGLIPKGVDITGTDISNSMLEQCKVAKYDSLSIARGLSQQRKAQFFQQTTDGFMQIKEPIRRMVNFRHLNLLDSYTLMGKYDIIFCRNVLIYFSTDLKAKIIQQFFNSLHPDSFLFLGASESMAGLNSDFTMLRCNPGIIYQKQIKR